MEDLIDILALGEYNLDDVEDALLNEILNDRRPAVRRDAHGRINLNSLKRNECKLLFRFYPKDLRILGPALGIPAQITTEQYYNVTGLKGLCIYLRQLAYPNRLLDLEKLFGISAPYLSVFANRVMSIINDNKGHLLNNLGNLEFLSEERLRYYAQDISMIYSATILTNCHSCLYGNQSASYFGIEPPTLEMNLNI